MFILWCTSTAGVRSKCWQLSSKECMSVMVHAWSCSFQKNNHRMAFMESPMMATSPIVQYNPYHQPALSEFIPYTITTQKPSFLSLPSPTSTTHYSIAAHLEPHKLHTHSMSQAYHIMHAPVLKVMSFG